MTVTPIRSADEALSATLAAFDARQELAKRDPLVALAFHAWALVDGRCDVDRSDTALLAMIGEEARRALERTGADLSRLDELYPLPRPHSAKPLFDLIMRSGRR